MSDSYNNSVEALFQPFSFRNLSLSNRIVMAPMTREFSPKGVPGSDVAAYYRRRAEKGVGLIITEGTAINHPAAVTGASIPNFHGEESLNGWSQVVTEVHEAGGKIMPQLWHVGISHLEDLPNFKSFPIGPSGLSLTGERVTNPMTEVEITEVIEAYARAAANAKSIGFDGIEIHGAHGYLIDQFFWEKTNKRVDQYGGDIVGRTRFAVEIIKACRRAVGSSFPISFRYSQWKMDNYKVKLADTPEQLASFLTPLVEAGADVFHCSTRRFWEPEFEGSHLNLASWTKKLTGKPTITVGSVGLDGDFIGSFKGKEYKNVDINDLIWRIEQGEFDLIAVGRALLADPSWAFKVRDNRMNEIIPFTRKALESLL